LAGDCSIGAGSGRDTVVDGGGKGARAQKKNNRFGEIIGGRV